jgi:hypothetical protein
VCALALTSLLVACGAGGEPGGPPANSPNAGVSGYTKIKDTYVLADATAALSEPAVVADSPDGPFQIWVTYAGTDIRRADLPALGMPATPLRPALAATEPWEGSRVLAPSIERTASGTYQMVYEAAGGVIGRADSTDGETWTAKRMVTLGHHPTLAAGVLMYEQDGAVVAETADAFPPLPIVTGTSPDLHLRTTAAGRQVWALFYNCPGASGTAGPSIAICFAGSFDGIHFVVSASPALDPRAPDELGPAAILGETGGTLFFAQVAGPSPLRIAAAQSP